MMPIDPHDRLADVLCEVCGPAIVPKGDKRCPTCDGPTVPITEPAQKHEAPSGG